MFLHAITAVLAIAMILIWRSSSPSLQSRRRRRILQRQLSWLVPDLQPEIEHGVRTHTFLQTTAARYKQHGRTFAAATRGSPEIHTIEPANLQAILATSFEDFGFEPLRRESQRAFWGKGILNSDGAAWKHERGLLRPIFRRTEVGNTAVFAPHIQRFTRTILEHLAENESVDLEPLLRFYALDTSTEFLFGEAVGAQTERVNGNDGLQGSLDASMSEGQVFMRAFEEISVMTGAKRQTGMQKSRWYSRLFGKPRVDDREYKEGPTQAIHDFVDKRVRRAIDQKHQRLAGKGGHADGDIGAEQQRVIAVNILAETSDNVTAIRSQLLHMFMPASEATGTLVGSALFALARKPDVWAKLRAKILESVEGEYTFEKVKNIAYLRWVIQEALRLYPPIIGSKRIALCDTSLPTGGGAEQSSPITVPKGTVVNFSYFALQRDPELWGPDAEDFVPERWATERPDWRFLPFNGGPRICVAQQYVHAEASYLLVSLARRFVRIEAADDRPWTEGLKFTMRSKFGVKVRLIPANEGR